MTRPKGIEKIIHKQYNMAGNRVANAQEPNVIEVEGVGFGIAANGHVNGAVCSGLAPEFIADFHIALPFDCPAYFLLLTEFDR